MDAFANMMDSSITLDDFERGKFISIGEVSSEERNDSQSDNLDWIISKIANTINGVTFDEMKTNPVVYDALAYQFQLLGSIISNAESSDIERYSTYYGIDFSDCIILPEMLLTTVYPRMLYNAGIKLTKTLNHKQ